MLYLSIFINRSICYLNVWVVLGVPNKVYRVIRKLIISSMCSDQNKAQKNLYLILVIFLCYKNNLSCCLKKSEHCQQDVFGNYLYCWDVRSNLGFHGTRVDKYRFPPLYAKYIVLHTTNSHISEKTCIEKLEYTFQSKCLYF